MCAISSHRLILGSALLLIAMGQLGCSLLLGEQSERRASDPAFILLGDELAPDGMSRIVRFQYDTGAFGYSRVWWAIAPASYEQINLVDYELPDGYMAEGWGSDGKLLVSKWIPYYFAKGEKVKVELHFGDVYKGRTIEIVEHHLQQSENRRRHEKD